MRNKHGFTLIEAVVSIAIFVLFIMGIYGGIQLVLKIVYSSRIRIIETALLNEQIELVRNMSFFDVGIINGSPAGLLDRDVTVIRNGITFNITRTIRNIDDPYDGTVGGDPADTAPADYKFVDMSIICSNCTQQQALSMQTYIAPKFLEGDPTHGALFIEVFDATAQPVSGATVHITATTTDPQYDFYDTTDSDGMLRLVDMAGGVASYHITVTKAGYTSDMTVDVNEEQSNPVKQPASVIAQSVTAISFSIDKVSTIDVSTINALCQVVPNTAVSIRGSKLSGTNPETYKVDTSFTTDASGLYILSNMIWDNYSFSVLAYDVIGIIPDVPLLLTPDTAQSLSLLLGTNTAHSLLITVTDDGQPLAGATVTVSSTSNGFFNSDISGVGSISQTDWSGGSGQEIFSDETRYYDDNSAVDVLTSSGNIMLLNTGSAYINSGWLESSVIDVGVLPQYVSLEWSPLFQSPLVGADAVLFQLASSASSSPETWEYLGSDGTNATYYNDILQEIHSIHDGDRYMRYKVFLHTDDTSVSPTLSDVSAVYTNSCIAPGQVYMGSLTEGDYSVIVSANGYQTKTIDVPVSGDIRVAVEMVAE